ncbi:hypothetical protein KAH81_00325 [bacterium]|nr:hypothetical protein [bacterium]
MLVLPWCLFAWSYGDVVFNELMWMGTTLSPYDEFLELRNMTSSVIDFSHTPWCIYRQDELMLIIDDGILPANGLFIICRRNGGESRITAARDFVSNAMVLTNSNTHYSLYAGMGSTSPLMDVADDGDGPPMSGRFIMADNIRWAMERNDIPGEGDDPTSWHPACLSIGFIAGARERGTPGAPNYKNLPPPEPSLSISPDFLADDSTICALAIGVDDLDSIPGKLNTIFDWFEEGAPLITEIDSIYPFVSSIPESLTKPGFTYSVSVYIFDGTDSTGPIEIDSIQVHFEKGDLIISELAWAGSMTSPEDEWMEIFNNSSKPVDFLQTPIMVATGSPALPESVFTFDNGVLAPSDYWLIANFSNTNPHSVLDVLPDMVDERIEFDDDSLYVALIDFPESEGYSIDEAGNGIEPFAGASQSSDSLKYSMARSDFDLDGNLPSSWHTSEVSIGFKANRLERGSPGSPNLRNFPPVLEWLGIGGYAIDGIEPHFGTMDTLFVWRVRYTDLDDSPPEWVDMLLDIDCDGDFDLPHERTRMYRNDLTDTIYSDGAIYKAWQLGLPPAPSCCGYTFRASDGLVLCALGMPMLSGPEVSPTMRIYILGPIWRPDPAFAGEVISTSSGQMPFIFNTGDTPFEIGLKIVDEDIYSHSSDTFSFSAGGWAFTSEIDSAGINEYRLSAVFIHSIEAPDTSAFNEDSEDLLTDSIKWFDSDTLGCPACSLDTIFQPGARWRLAFRLDLPPEAYGFYAYWEHRIAIRVFLREPLP